MNVNLISVIIPVFRSNPVHLRECLQSVLNQTYSNLEIIIIYKKDPDNSDSEIKDLLDLVSKDSRIKKIESDVNVVDARNLAIKSSRGEFIGIMDADDICSEDRFQEQLEFMKTTGLSIVGSWAYSISDDGDIIGTIEPPFEWEDIRKKIIFHNPILHSSVLMQKSMLEKIGYYRLEFFPGAEDYELFLRAIHYNYTVGILPKYLISLRETKSSIMRGSKWKKARMCYLKAKKIAIFEYGFKGFYDVLFFLLTPITIFVNPKTGHVIKKIIGWNKRK